MTDFLLDAGTNGYLASPFDLLSTELNSLASVNTALSSVGGTSGVYTQTNTANAPQGDVYFTSGGTFTPSAGAYIAGWFIRSPDGGSTFEFTASNVQMARGPDFIIPFINSALASGSLVWSPSPVSLPWPSFKVFIFNSTGGALPATGNHITLGPTALKF